MDFGLLFFIIVCQSEPSCCQHQSYHSDEQAKQQHALVGLTLAPA